MRRIYLILVSIFHITFIYSQVPGDTVEIKDDELFEDLIETQTQDNEDSELLDRILKLREKPVELNSADETELLQIPYIDAIIAVKIIQYRKRIGKFRTVRELTKVEGIDDELYEKIKVLVYISNTRFDFVRDEYGKLKKPGEMYKDSFVKKLLVKYRSRFSNDLQPAMGYLNGKYPGIKSKLYNRILADYSVSGYKISAGLLTEKDPGEQSYMDHVAGFIEVKSPLIISQILLGDYSLEFGQGITLWGNYSFSKGSEAVYGIKKKGIGINSYTSTNEVQYFRGGAIKFGKEISQSKFSLWAFYSNNYIDASVDTLRDMLLTIYTDGYHRTDSEMKRKNSARELFYGGRLQYENENIYNLKCGFTYYRSSFNKAFAYKSLYEFRGDKANGMGIDYDLLVPGNVNLYGEWARSYNDKVGGISGIRFSFLKTAEVLVSVRNYPAGFIMLHSYGFGERSGNTRNERGIYTGIRFKIPKIVTVNAYYDQYKFPNRTFFIPVPSGGNDFLMHTEWRVTSDLKLYTRYKHENKEDVTRLTDEAGLEVRKIYTRTQVNYRLQMDYELLKKFRVRSRVEYVFVNNKGLLPSEKGILFFSDIRVKAFNNLIFDGRFIYFQTDSYDSRLYAYESEISGVITNQGLYGKGRRWYVLIKYKPFSVLELSAKYSETVIEGAKTIGSGNDRIEGDLKSRFAFQIDLKF